MDDSCEPSIEGYEIMRVPWYVEQYLRHLLPPCLELRVWILLHELHSFLINLILRLTLLQLFIHIIEVTL